jgi:hypothetical protein
MKLVDPVPWNEDIKTELILPTLDAKGSETDPCFFCSLFYNAFSVTVNDRVTREW